MDVLRAAFGKHYVLGLPCEQIAGLAQGGKARSWSLANTAITNNSGKDNQGNRHKGTLKEA